MLGQDDFLKHYQKRLPIFSWVIVCMFTIVLSRLAWLQLMNGDRFKRLSEENRIRKIEVPAPRGMILDREKKLIVDNRPTFDVQIVPQFYKNLPKAERNELIERLAVLIKMTPEEILKKLKDKRREAKYKPVKIKQDINRKEVARLETNKLELPSVEVAMEIKRTYLNKNTGAHLFGYLGRINNNELKKFKKEGLTYKRDELIGKTALEKKYEKTLKGTSGLEFLEVDAFGRKKLKSDNVLALVNQKEATPGNNLILTIDEDLQKAAKKAMEGMVGGVIAIDPNSGEILAQVSVPAFDPTIFSRGTSGKTWQELRDNPNNPMRDKTYQDHYSPGSIYKLVTAIAALEEGIADANTIYNCPGYMKLGNRRYHCHARGGHGNVNIVQALERSCDVFFYRVAHKMGIDTLSRYATMLGLGKSTGIDYGTEVPGLIPTKAWKKRRYKQDWITGETLSCGIGQSFVLATPLQLVNLYAAVANGKFRYRPFVVDRIEDSSGITMKEFQPKVLSEVQLKPKTLELVRKGLFEVVNGKKGTARSVQAPGLQIAGKTGTIQVVHFSADKIYQKCDELEFRFKHHGMFVGYAPFDNPKIAVAVIAEHSCSSKAAIPIAKAVIKTYLSKYYKKNPEEAPPEYFIELEREKLLELKNLQQEQAPELVIPTPDEKKEPTNVNL